jgi:hydroxyacylglutathione hydrolase
VVTEAIAVSKSVLAKRSIATPKQAPCRDAERPDDPRSRRHSPILSRLENRVKWGDLPARNKIHCDLSFIRFAGVNGMSPNLRIRTIVSRPFDENTYVVGRADRADVLVVDPGFEPNLILDYLRDEGLTVAAIVNTHGHVDHIAGNAPMKRAFPEAPIIIGHGDAAMLTDADLNLSGPYGLPITSPPADRTLREGDRLELAGLDLEVFEVPGHSSGHVVFLLRDKPHVLIGGDVLFRGSVGRTDFPGGSFEQLSDGIRAKLWPLPDDTVVYPGHGPVTKIGREKRSNPFVGDGTAYPM